MHRNQPSSSRPQRKFLLLCDSRDRDLTFDGVQAKTPGTSLDRGNSAPFQYRIDFTDTSLGVVENVKRLELKAASVPKARDELYVLLDIGSSYKSDFVATNQRHGTETFGVLYFDHDAMTTGAVKPMKGSDFSPKYVDFDPPLSSIKHLDICLRKYDGSVLTKGDVVEDLSADCTSIDPVTSYMFELTTLDRIC